MRITVLGTGYLGATHAASMAEMGFDWIWLLSVWQTGPEAGTTFYIHGAGAQPGFSAWAAGEPGASRIAQ